MMRQFTQLKAELKVNRRRLLGTWNEDYGFGVDSLSWWFGAGKFSW